MVQTGAVTLPSFQVYILDDKIHKDQGEGREKERKKKSGIF